MRIYGESDSQKNLEVLMRTYLDKIQLILSDNTFKTT